MPELILDNKTCPLKVPGFHNIPIDVELPQDQFAAGIQSWRGTILTAKELAMLDLVNTITERPNWHVRIFQQEEIARWREDAMSSSPLINDPTWSWCLKELQDKAREFEKRGHMLVFNTGSGVCKSDTAISSNVQSELRDATVSLIQDLDRETQSLAVQKSPVVNLIDPSLFPLVHGRTKVLTGGQTCGMDQASWSSCIQEGQAAPEQPQFPQENSRLHWLSHDCIWSTKFQWLPCEVEFTGPPGSTEVRITSYINNLHPTNRNMYSAIETVLASSIKQWNEILIRAKWTERPGYRPSCEPKPREPIRLRTYGVDWKARFPEWAKRLPDESKEKHLPAEEYERMCAQVEAYLQEPESKDKVHWFLVHTQRIPEDWRTRWGLQRTALTKYARTFFFEHSDPGTAYSYDDWKAGRTSDAIVGPAGQENWRPVFETEQFLLANPWLKPYRWAYEPKGEKDDDHQFYTVALQDEFREKGLQVVVKMHSIELEPDMPSFSGEDWHTEGNANEHIVANAIYAFDSDNISKPQISFRQRLSHAGDRYVYDKIGAGDDPDDDESDFEDVEYSDPEDALIFGPPDPEEKYACWDVKYIGRLFGFETIQHAPAWQEIGKVRMPPGRLISFPNAFQYRIGLLELQDKTKPGHCRFLTLSLVDPTYRICSTRNVPPQQPDWTDGSGSQMDLKEALKLKEELMKVHVRKDEATFELARTIVFTGFQ